MFYRYRVVFVLAALAVAAGAAASVVTWQKWVPVTTCLLCDTHSGDSSAITPSATNGPATGGRTPAYVGSSAASGADPLAPLPLGGNLDDGGGRSHGGGSLHGWQPWGPSSGTRRVSSSSGSGPSAPLGGLWRLMNLARPASHNGSGVPAVHVATVHSTTPRQPAPPRAPSAGNHHSAPPVGTSAPAINAALPTNPIDGAVTAPALGVPPTDPFHEHETPTPPPFGGGGHTSGGFDPGTPGTPGAPGGHPVSGGGVSPTPEPASVLLIGTGLFAILGVLRRRRLI